ncbi:MAG: VWA domain-containing protein [Gammaproteobacteria bacterium]|nr:VWA domain-containing protein [Gammaproteobacteria bacterium]
MEEAVGKIWHRLISRAADSGHPEAAVTLDEVATTVGVLFRALGGDGALQVKASEATALNARRSWLQRIAGSQQEVELAWFDENTLRLPSSLSPFPERVLNRELYLWLAALAACGQRQPEFDSLPWLARNRHLTQLTLERYPGLRALYLRLAAAQLEQRPDPATLPPAEAEDERAIQQALCDPRASMDEPGAANAPQPVHLWLHPSPPLAGEAGPARHGDSEEPQGGGESRDGSDRRKRRAERSEEPQEGSSLLVMRMEAMLSTAEFIKLDRGTEEEEDLELAKSAADAMEMISLSTQGPQQGSRIRFDLDLPSAADDDTPLGGGILLPEWSWKKRQLLPDHCRLQPMVARHTENTPLPEHLKRTARKLRRQFQALAPARSWQRAQHEGTEVDLDAYERFISQRASGQVAEDGRLYRSLRSTDRDLSCLLLADLSLSTDASLNNDHRIIDVIRDSLYLFADALSASGDRFALYGFSSLKREHIRFHQLKTFDERYDGRIRGRLAALKPGFYTRMGAAIRHATTLLQQQPNRQRLLLILTDGKPNDLDQYEGRYGIEDTRQAVVEARRQGLRPFCVTIDRQGSDYLPYLFGNAGYVVIRKPTELPQRLPLLYAQLTS